MAGSGGDAWRRCTLTPSQTTARSDALESPPMTARCVAHVPVALALGTALTAVDDGAGAEEPTGGSTS